MKITSIRTVIITIKSENDVDFHREKLKLTPEEFEEIATKLSK